MKGEGYEEYEVGASVNIQMEGVEYLFKELITSLSREQMFRKLCFIKCEGNKPS